MFLIRPVSTVVAVAFCVSCSALSHRLNYPEENASEETVLDAGETDRHAETMEAEPLSWNDLTRLARQHVRDGQLDRAEERLNQAAIQVADLSATNVSRRTVFGLRARLAIQIAESGELEVADQLADQLFAEAAESPEVGGSALVSLAVAVADRRETKAREAGDLQASQLELLRIALMTAKAGSISRDRMELAVRVSAAALRENDLALARMAIDQGLLDAEQVVPRNKGKMAGLQLHLARVARRQRDFETAESSAKLANRMLDEADADASTRGMAEAILAEILADKGDLETALAIASGANARIGDEQGVSDHAQRRILAALARVERSSGETAAARIHLEQALAIPGVDQSADIELVDELTRELREHAARGSSEDATWGSSPE